MPGGQLNHLFDSIHRARDKLQLIHPRHEQGAAYMAFGHSELDGLQHYGPAADEGRRAFTQVMDAV